MITREHKAPDGWPLLRAAVANAANDHWRALSKIAPVADPRTVAAETLATQACHLAQTATLWELVHLGRQLFAGDIRALEHTDIAEQDVLQLQRQLESLDHAASCWAECAYGVRARAERANGQQQGKAHAAGEQ